MTANFQDSSTSRSTLEFCLFHLKTKRKAVGGLTTQRKAQRTEWRWRIRAWWGQWPGWVGAWGSRCPSCWGRRGWAQTWSRPPGLASSPPARSTRSKVLRLQTCTSNDSHRPGYNQKIIFSIQSSETINNHYLVMCTAH